MNTAEKMKLQQYYCANYGQRLFSGYLNWLVFILSDELAYNYTLIQFEQLSMKESLTYMHDMPPLCYFNRGDSQCSDNPNTDNSTVLQSCTQPESLSYFVKSNSQHT